jgi:hypothetical protein
MTTKHIRFGHSFSYDGHFSLLEYAYEDITPTKAKGERWKQTGCWRIQTDQSSDWMASSKRVVLPFNATPVSKRFVVGMTFETPADAIRDALDRIDADITKAEAKMTEMRRRRAVLTDRLKEAITKIST